MHQAWVEDERHNVEMAFEQAKCNGRDENMYWVNFLRLGRG